MDLAYSRYSVYVYWLFSKHLGGNYMLHLYINIDFPPFTDQTEVMDKLNNLSKVPQQELYPFGWQVSFLSYLTTRLFCEMK